MFFRSLFWERTVPSLLERVEHLPSNVQAEIATRAGEFIKLARTAGDEVFFGKICHRCRRGASTSTCPGRKIYT
jgi:hypothetical protein